MNWAYETILGKGSNDPMMFEGEVEIDESLFGRACKYHKGAKKGMQVNIYTIIFRKQMHPNYIINALLAKCTIEKA